jgi:hypothetical protein
MLVTFFLSPHPEIANYYHYSSSCCMRAIIFDMDGVLVESMPYHYKAMKTAIKELTDIDLDKRTFYLLEGMPVAGKMFLFLLTKFPNPES